MPNEEWGTKRVCPTTGKRFYDLNKNPIVSPYSGEEVSADTGKSNRTMAADKADKASEAKKKADEAEAALKEDDTSDVDLGDDVLDDDDDNDNVSLDEIADVAVNDDDD